MSQLLRRADLTSWRAWSGCFDFQDGSRAFDADVGPGVLARANNDELLELYDGGVGSGGKLDLDFVLIGGQRRLLRRGHAGGQGLENQIDGLLVVALTRERQLDLLLLPLHDRPGRSN